MKVLPKIVSEPEYCGGNPRLSGTRMCVHDIVSYVQLYDGDVWLAWREAMRHLTMQQVRVALNYYEEHREEIDEILRRRREDYERGLAEQGK